MLTAEAIEVALVNPTNTCFSKSIIDATAPVRSFLSSHGIHDFASQGRGAKEHGVKLTANFVEEDRETPVTLSLYKPAAKPAKNGDPRLWIYRLKRFASPGDILALLDDAGQTAIVNLSRANLAHAMTVSSGPLAQLVRRISARSSETATELLEKIRAIAARGWIRSVMDEPASTAIGRTLEHELGIPMNPSKDPDYKGIELKAARVRKAKPRHQLFGRVPNWAISKFKSMQQVLDELG